jgi:phosphoribosylglycinamide formyltransferase-1
MKSHGVELVVLAGFLSLLGEKVCNEYKNSIINVHPSLIPAFCGKGHYGIIPHQKALEYGVKVTGATVHFVETEYDSGPIILQKAVEVIPGDTPETLQRRVMEQAEWQLLPEAIRLYSEGRLKINGRHVEILRHD